jgi:hypothetical protein
MISNRRVKNWFLYYIFKILVFLINEVENTLIEFRSFDGYLMCLIFFKELRWVVVCIFLQNKSSI